MVTAIIIPACNEESVIGRCLDTIQHQATHGEFEVIVVANGCTDGTVAQAARRGVRVIDLADSGKAGALNAGDAAASGFPRLYLDADMALTADDIRTLSATLQAEPAYLAGVPRRVVDVADRPLTVRAYYGIQQRLPIYESGLVGRCAVMVSETGRTRFSRFPDETGDDLFLDALFAPDEYQIVDSVAGVVKAPYTTRDLIRRLVRVRRGNIQLRRASLTASAPGQPVLQVRRSDRWAWLRDVVLPHPKLAPAGAIYVVITLIAAWQARRSLDQQTWGRDESTRRASPG